MESLLQQLALKIPELVLFCIVLFVWLKHLEKKDGMAERKDTVFLQCINQVTQRSDDRARECHEVHRQSIEAMSRNAHVSNSLQKTLDRMEGTLNTLHATANSQSQLAEMNRKIKTLVTEKETP